MSMYSLPYDPKADAAERQKYSEVQKLRCIPFLYVLEIEDVGVKVGISADPRGRFALHKRNATDYKRRVTRWWLSKLCPTAAHHERVIVGTSKSEFLPRQFDEVVEQAEALSNSDQNLIPYPSRDKYELSVREKVSKVMGL